MIRFFVIDMKQNTRIMRLVAKKNTISRVLLVVFFSLIAFHIAFAVSFGSMSDNQRQANESNRFMTSIVYLNQ